MPAPKLMHNNPAVSEERKQLGHRKKDAIESFLSRPPMMVKASLSQLRYMILMDGLTVQENSEEGQCAYRSAVWSILLRVNPAHSADYIQAVQKGPSDSYSKIRDDTFRTYAKDTIFKNKVSEESLSRVLNAYAWRQQNRNYLGQAAAQRRVMSKSQETYVQGMNILAAPFLYVCKSEAHAFFMFETLLTKSCPRYVTPSVVGVHSGTKLVGLCLKTIDSELYSHIHSKLLTPDIYAFPPVLSISACTPPLKEVLILWDFLFAYGIHLNIIMVVAQMVIIREQLLASSNPMSFLRSFPPLNAKETIRLGLIFLSKLDDKLYDLVKRHAYDDTVDPKIDELITKQNTTSS